MGKLQCFGSCFGVLMFLSVATCQLYGPNRVQTVNRIFQIPIMTLTAVNNAVGNSRPVGDVIIQRLQRVQQLQQQFQQLQPQQEQYDQGSNYISTYTNTNGAAQTNYYRNRASRAGQIAGLFTAADGSGFRI